MTRFRRLLLIAGLVAGSATALASVPNASATNQTYSCSSCTAINGEDNWILDAEGDNYSYEEVILYLWKKTSGGYEKAAYAVVGAYRGEVCYSAKKSEEFVGHGETAAGVNAHLSGRETNITECKF